jgi:hypothetical protein
MTTSDQPTKLKDNKSLSLNYIPYNSLTSFIGSVGADGFKITARH